MGFHTVQVRDGRWAALEMKLGQADIDRAASDLLRVATHIETERHGDPAFLAVITGWGFAYRREDGAWSPRSEPKLRTQVDQPAMLPVARATRAADDVTMDDAPDDRDTLIDENGVEIVSTPITIAHLEWTAERTFGDLGLVKAVVDLERRVMAIGGGLHVDEQAALLNDGSRQRDV